MKVVFTPIDNILPIDLTIGKVYEVIKISDNVKSPTKDYHLIKNDKGKHYSYWIGNFTEISVYRKNQINHILS